MSIPSAGWLRLSGVSALIGAATWAYKSLAILVSGEQPDYWFEYGLAFMGLSVLGFVLALRAQLTRFRRLLIALGWVAAVSGLSAGLVYTLQGDDGLFGAAALFTVLSIVVVLFLSGGEIRRLGLLRKYSFGPQLLAWLFVLSIPIGGVLSAVDDRLLEIGLLGVVAGWLILAMGTLADETALVGAKTQDRSAR